MMKIKLSTFNMLAMILIFIASVATGRLTGELALLGGILVTGYFSVYLKDWEWDVERLSSTVQLVSKQTVKLIGNIATYRLKVK